MQPTDKFNTVYSRKLSFKVHLHEESYKSPVLLISQQNENIKSIYKGNSSFEFDTSDSLANISSSEIDETLKLKVVSATCLDCYKLAYLFIDNA